MARPESSGPGMGTGAGAGAGAGPRRGPRPGPEMKMMKIHPRGKRET